MHRDKVAFLKGVTEYGEGHGVILAYYRPHDIMSDINNIEHEKKLCVEAWNDGRSSSVYIDARQLYEALKNYFETEQKEQKHE